MSATSKLATSKKGPTTAVRMGLALAGVAGVAATLGGYGTHAAQAETTEPFGTTNLMQSADIGSVKDSVGELNFQQSDLYGARTVSTCTGEQGLGSLAKDKRLITLGSRWSNEDGVSGSSVTEAIAQAGSRSEAKRAAQNVLAALQSCQHEPTGHWHYGQLYHGPLRNGDHVWMDTIDADGTVSGGVGVMLQGLRLGVVEVSSVPTTVGDGDDAIKNTLLPAEERLAG